MWRDSAETVFLKGFSVLTVRQCEISSVAWRLPLLLPLRLLMSYTYIYIYIYIYIYMEYLFLMFLDHTQRRSTVGRTPLDE